MAYPYSRRGASFIQGELIPTVVMIKNIPLDWTRDNMLQLMDQRKLPSPSNLKYLYDDHLAFRGLAFAEFVSSGEAWRVIQDLNSHQVSGRRLRVEQKRKRPQLTSREDATPPRHFQATPVPRSNIPDKAYPHSQAKAPSAANPTGEPRPPSESYDLLMSYQTNPIEKEKLKQFLALTGDYQEAVNEFAKNRARETQEGEHGWVTEEGTIMEVRAPTPWEEMQIDEMEEQFGIGGRAFWNG